MKRWSEENTLNQEFQIRDDVLLFSSRLNLFMGNLKNKLSGPLMLMYVYPSVEIDLEYHMYIRIILNG